MPDIIPEGFESQRQLRTRTGDNLDMVISSGYVRFSMKGAQDGTWNRQELVFRVGPQWSAVRGTIPVVSPSSIMNLKVANDAGWAVDRVKLSYFSGGSGPPGLQVELRCGLAVRDKDGFMFRVNYHVTTVGRLEAASISADDLTLLNPAELTGRIF